MGKDNGDGFFKNPILPYGKMIRIIRRKSYGKE